MYETFENLPEDRKEQILQVCIEEFAKNGFGNTSTNTIVKRLGISKGLLFLYFKNKVHLYLYLIDYLIKIYYDKFFSLFPNQKPTEFIEIFNFIGDFYKVLIIENPYILVFFLKMEMNVPPEIKQEIDFLRNEYHERFLKNLNMNYLRKDINIQKMLDLLHMASYHVGQMILSDYDGDMDCFKKYADKYIREYNEYIDIIKLGAFEVTVHG